MRRKVAGLIATFFYVGYIPIMPGTCASIVTMVLWFLLPPLSCLALLLILLVIGSLGVWASSVVEQENQIKDPSYIVIDEVFGMIIALASLPHLGCQYLGALLFFRLFDISKIFPIYLVEQHVPGGWGIMGDDLVAGLMARSCIFLLYPLTGGIIVIR